MNLAAVPLLLCATDVVICAVHIQLQTCMKMHHHNNFLKMVHGYRWQQNSTGEKGISTVLTDGQNNQFFLLSYL